MYDCIHCGCHAIGQTRKSIFSVKPSRISTRSRSHWQAVSPRAVGQQGFSVVEAMVGFVILGITLTALCGGFSFGFNTIKLSQEEVRADQILVQKLESLRVYKWNAINSLFITPNFTNYYSTSNTARGATYVGTMTVTNFSSTGESYSNTLKQVTATVSWFSENMNHTRSMSTLVSQNGLLTYTNSP